MSKLTGGMKMSSQSNNSSTSMVLSKGERAKRTKELSARAEQIQSVLDDHMFSVSEYINLKDREDVKKYLNTPVLKAIDGTSMSIGEAIDLGGIEMSSMIIALFYDPSGAQMKLSVNMALKTIMIGFSEVAAKETLAA